MRHSDKDILEKFIRPEYAMTEAVYGKKVQKATTKEEAEKAENRMKFRLSMIRQLWDEFMVRAGESSGERFVFSEWLKAEGWRYVGQVDGYYCFNNLDGDQVGVKKSDGGTYFSIAMSEMKHKATGIPVPASDVEARVVFGLFGL